MEVTLEQVERLREKADISYAQAKEALEYSGGNLLDALIYLEELGAIPRAEGTYYSTRGEAPPAAEEGLVLPEEPEGEEREARPKRGLLHRIRYLLLDNELEVWRKERPIIALPVLILLLLLLAAFWLTASLLVLGLFFGFRYRFSGPDLEREELNGAMENAADTAAGLGRQIMDELRAQHEKFSGKNERR